MAAQVVCGEVPLLVGFDLFELGPWQHWLAALGGDEQPVLVDGEVAFALSDCAGLEAVALPLYERVIDHVSVHVAMHRQGQD